MKITLGSVLYYWPRETLLSFYESMAMSPVECIYLGEAVCSKRHALRLGEWTELARSLKASGKEVVLSSLALLEAQSELSALRRLCDNGEFLVEANDIAAVQMLSERKIPFVAGLSVNLYNGRSLAKMLGLGLQRWVVPVELSKTAIAEILSECQALAGTTPEVEIFGFGRLPLAWSARCFTARHHNKPKDQCGFICGDYPEGLKVASQDGTDFLVINGIQTLAALVYDLSPDWAELESTGISHFRVSPERQHTDAVLQCLDEIRQGGEARIDEALRGGKACSGYWHGRPGME
ncbi:MAG: U32 family peptidase [Gammaproteobacteria bacterium]|nr:U32 family peptidase [Gammaproteobacteria bacterium]